MRILEALRAGEPLDAHELAERVQLHPNTVRAHLHVLVEAGLARARREERTKPGRPRIVYEAAPEPERPTPAEPYRLLAKILAGCLDASGDDPVVRAEEAGRAWGRYLVGRPAPFTSVSSENALGELVRLLDEYGFEPSLESSEQERLLWMHACPFREVAASHQTVVCGVHLGLIQGALAELGGRVEADRIEPFVEPGLCLAHLRDSDA